LASIFDKLLRAGEGKLVRKLEAIAAEVNALEPSYQALSDEELKGETVNLRER
jgi:preprotein translocase subunit SecA